MAEWERRVPDSRSRKRYPLTSCAYAMARPPNSISGTAYYFAQGSWAELAAHKGHRVVNFGNSDGSAISIDVFSADWTNAWQNMYWRTWGKQY